MRSRGWWFSQQGVDAPTIMGDTCPTIFPFSSSKADDAASFWTVSRWAARFVDMFPDITHSDRLACWIVIFVNFQVGCSFDAGVAGDADNLQWQICPDEDTYRAMPDWYRPIPVQNFVPHMACLDILIWYVIALFCLYFLSSTHANEQGRLHACILPRILRTLSKLS